MAALPDEWPLANRPPGFDSPSTSLAHEQSADSFLSLYRYDSPQLTLHDFHKFQQSPVLLESPELDFKRVRRKPSTANLAASSPQVAEPPHWSPSAILPRPSHAFSQQNFVSSLPPAPFTPRPRPFTASPSLSSTVTTLQSSPTQTPIYRGGAFSERVRDEDEVALAEPIRTKRKFDTPRRAKRLPRYHGSGESGGGGSGQEDLWEVYALVFDPPLEQRVRGLAEAAAEESDREELEEQLVPKARRERAVRFQGVGDQTEASARASSDRQSGVRNRTATSSLSLSRFEFPKPPGRDDWAGTFGHLNEATTPPSTPATILYRGASFDVVNPHTSLLLGTRDFETPAEIDGLLDDYFDGPIADMQYDSLTGEPSQASLRTPSEGSRRILYDDPDSARRRILRVEGGSTPSPSPPPSAVLRNKRSPSARLISVASANAASKTGGVRGSDPFDLTLSESGSQNRLQTIDNMLQEERSADLAPASGVKAHGLGISDQDDGVETLATSDHSTDPTIKDILNGYDYTRVPLSSLVEADIAESPSVERGLTAGDNPSYETSYGLLSPAQTPGGLRAGSSRTFGREQNKTTHSQAVGFPTPPPAAHTGLYYYTGCSELPTSDQSYGETNQLLMITPEPAYIPPYSPAGCDPHTCQHPAHIHVEQQGTRLGAHAMSHEVENEATLAELVATAQRFSARDTDDPDPELARRLLRSSSFYPEDAEGDWETQHTDSRFDLHHPNARTSIESYADTSFCGSQWRLSIGPMDTYESALSPIPGSPSPSKNPGGFSFYPRIASPMSLEPAAAEEKRRLGIKKEIKQLEADIMDYTIAERYGGRSSITEAQRRADMERLNSLRQLVPTTTDQLALKVSKSVSSLKENSANKLQKVNVFRPKFHQSDSYSRAAKLGKHPAAMDSASDCRGLLSSSPSPSLSPAGLAYSDSTQTFVTIREPSPADVRGKATKLWSPFDKDPTTRAIRPGTPLRQTPAPKEIELGPISSKSKRAARAAMSSQYEPRQLHLLKGKRLTDRQLAAREPTWNNLPKDRTASTFTRQGSGISSGEPMLLKHGSEIELALKEEQKVVSKRYLYACAWFPPLALAFGLGAFDRMIKKKTSGNVSEASRKEKRNALLIFFPMGVMFWTAGIITIWIIVLVVPHTNNQARSSNSSAPF